MPVKLTILGDFGVGKTSMLKKLSSISGNGIAGCCCAAFRPNESVDLEFDMGNDGKKMIVRIVDTAGQERYRSLTASFFRDIHGCLLVFNVGQNESFTNILNWHADLKKYTENAAVMLIGLSTASAELRDTREVTSERAFKLAEFLHTDFFETTLDDEEMMIWIIRQTMDKILRCMDSRGRGRLTSITPSNREGKRPAKTSSRKFRSRCC